jgi:hypothetical protein
LSWHSNDDAGGPSRGVALGRWGHGDGVAAG